MTVQMTTTRTKVAMTVCGYCSDGSHHLCPHAIRNGNRGLWVCTCTGPNCGGKILSCIDCKKVHDDVTPDTRQCVDKDACAARVQGRRDSNPIYQNIIIIKERSAMAKTEEAKVVREAKAKTGVCKCGCEGVTKGGNFLPGHDARFVSEQVSFVVAKSKTEAAARKEIGAISEALAAKFDKSLTVARDRAQKSADAEKARNDKKVADAKAKADKAAADKAAKAKADATA